MLEADPADHTGGEEFAGGTGQTVSVEFGGNLAVVVLTGEFSDAGNELLWVAQCLGAVWR